MLARLASLYVPIVWLVAVRDGSNPSWLNIGSAKFQKQSDFTQYYALFPIWAAAIFLNMLVRLASLYVSIVWLVAVRVGSNPSWFNIGSANLQTQSDFARYKESSTCTVSTKGQLISKANFKNLIWTKKQHKYFCISDLASKNP